MSSMPLVISVTSGKGGVGKTNFSANLAYTLSSAGKKVVLLDADLGLANVDVLLGLTPQKNLFHLFKGEASITDILCDTPYGFKILPASSGTHEMQSLTTGQKLELLEAVDVLDETVDYLIVDTGAGIHDNVIYFNLAAQERIVILTPEPTSLTDAYALIKILKTRYGVEHFKIVVNMALNSTQGKEVFTRLVAACDHFLNGVSLDYVGYLPKDILVRKAILDQKLFCVYASKSAAAIAMNSIAKNILQWSPPQHLDGNIKFFWKKLLFRLGSNS